MSPHGTRPDDREFTHSPAPRTVDAGLLLAQAGDEEFIENAYGELFGRTADTDGFLHYRFLLRAGFPPTAVLQAMARSAEGRRKHVVLENMPPAARLGPIRRAAFFLKLQVRMLIWKALERSGEFAERRQIDSAARYWHLVSASLTSQMRRQQELETSIHVWRREMDARFRRLEAALARPSAARMAATRAVPPGIGALLDRKLKPGMVVADVAAGDGVFLIEAARRIAPGGRVYCFESEHGPFTLLQENLGANGVLESGAAVAGRLDEAMGTIADLLAGETRLDLVRAGPASGRGIVELILKAAAGAANSLFWELSPEDSLSPPLDLIQRAADAGYRIWRVCPETGECTPLPAFRAAGPQYLLLEKAETGRKPE